MIENMVFEQQLAFGRQIEHEIAAALRERCGVIVTGDLPAEDGRGPALSGNGGRITIADLQFFGLVRRGWIEIKYKRTANYYENWDRLEHGIDTKKWLQYLDLQRQSRLTVYLLIVEGDSGEILMRDLNSINVFGRLRPGFWDKAKRIPSTNFDRHAMAIVGQFDEETGEVTFDWDVLDSFLSQLSLWEVGDGCA